MSFRASLAGSVMVVALAACAAAQDDDATTSDDVTTSNAAVQMNDVSIVLPLAKSVAEDSGFIKASDPGLGGPMIPAALYTSATHFPMTPPASIPVGSDIGMPYSNLRAVAYRIDPCFANVGPVTNDASCDNQLRVIFQSIAYGADGTASAADGGVHAFYRLSRADLLALVGEIVAARQANGGSADLGPLAPHPLVASQGLLGAEAKALTGIVKRYAGTQSFVRFTTFMSRNLQTVWSFTGFDVANGATTPMIIPSLPDQAIGVTFFAGFGGGLGGGFTPETQSPDDMQLIGNLANAKAATKAQQASAVDAAFAILNPNRHSPNTIDCASCHLAEPGLALTAKRDLGLSLDGNPNAFAPDPAFVSAADSASTTKQVGSGINVHMFSYRGANLMIGQRVINETAGVVAYLNGTIRPAH